MKILLGVCGSIAAYRTPDIARGLIKTGHQVRVVLTKGAENFVVPQVFSYLGVESVYSSDHDFKSKGVLHIDVARWCEQFVIALLSANTLSNLVSGQANDLLSSIFLALPKKTSKQYYPAMNTLMYEHPFVTRNLTELASLSATFICPPDSGELACGEEGIGKLPKVDRLVEMIPLINYKQAVKKKKVLITCAC